MKYMNEQDAISGKYAKAFVILNDNVEELFYAKSLESSIEKSKSDVPVLGKTNVGKKAAGWSGTGTLTIYYITSLFRQLMLEYVKHGRDFYFDLQVVNEDPASSAGKQTILLKNCNIDGVVAAKFDATSEDQLDEEISFTFDGFDILDSFNSPRG
ncbi:phage tail tube protein [Alkaliphilus peptidifermentans]|uniref:Phage tail tube protein n=1 Tax=Alkaliphilus peptidifermentans DSM 18978 TaxID=1120976 RepID=A0A1G5K064_9FIRM|nr:phage tail tube protein [Alkaliphilus peptidifermentans]SCY93259.1 Phage tail tube protein [Alkaliphilus peptidifermentans DSM 18978]